MSRNLSSRNTHFAQPGNATAQPAPASRQSRAQLIVAAIQAQQAAVEIDGAVTLYSAMRPSERRIAQQAIINNRYGQRQQASGMMIYVIPAAAPAQPATDQPKLKLSKQQRAAAEKKLVADLATLTTDMPAAVKPAKRRNRHERAQLAQ